MPTTHDECVRDEALRRQAVGRRPDGTPKDTGEVRVARATWRPAHCRAATINYELRVLFTFFLWAIKRNYLFLNPVAPVERFRVPKRALPKFMTTEELDEVLHGLR